MKTLHLARNLLFFALFCGVVLTAVRPAAAQNKGPRRTIKITLYFWPADTDREDLIPVTRRINPTRRVADAALRQLLKGVSADERERGLDDDYDAQVTGRPECDEKLIKPLINYYLGVSIKKGVATVNFSDPARCYIQTMIYMANRVLRPLEKTLLEFKTIKEVRIAFNGEVVTEWDA